VRDSSHLDSSRSRCSSKWTCEIPKGGGGGSPTQLTS